METLSSRVNMHQFENVKKKLPDGYFSSGLYSNFDADIADFKNTITRVKESKGSVAEIHEVFEDILISKGLNVIHHWKFRRAFAAWMDLDGEQQTFLIRCHRPMMDGIRVRKGLDAEEKTTVYLGWGEFVDDFIPNVGAGKEGMEIMWSAYQKAMTGKNF